MSDLDWGVIGEQLAWAWLKPNARARLAAKRRDKARYCYQRDESRRRFKRRFGEGNVSPWGMTPP